MNDEELLRYSRQIMLPQIDVRGQETLRASRVLIVGAGGLGSPAALYLAAAGIGRLTIADPDRVDISNLQRQILHGIADLERPKVDSARDALAAIDPAIRVATLHTRLEGRVLDEAVAGVDVVLDCSDNFATRFAVNSACFTAGIPLVSAAAVRFEGQLAVFDPRDAASPCYACLYRDGAATDETCADNGVLAPLVGVLGSLQAVETIKLLLQLGTPLCGRLVVFDALAHDWRTLRLPRDPACPVCAVRKPVQR